MMTEIGKFRTIAVADLARHRYPNEAGELRQDLLNLKAQKLIRQRRVMAGKGQEKLSVLVLTRRVSTSYSKNIGPPEDRGSMRDS